ncbi:AAA family ATPase [Helicobacter bizzozeronii]|uniref:AAA family ATPase n=3 Tax=Helicobacter bizzozeronii TaxID=56877 RepID=UPI001F27E99F|nr:AAA family ATPase [Helicobacter bizzozeronii]
MSYKSRVKNLIAELEKDLFEREECVRLVLLAMFAGKAIFLYGPPGTAKSMIARKVSLAFGEPKDFFSALMHRFSTPEDIFGPIDIGQLKQNRLVRNTKGYLPTASFAFLDEIWKSSPAILNTLLTIINERLFKEGDTDIKVPLKGIVCASNEFPPTNQGLEALYDRMLLRYFVEPLKSKENFLKLITSQEGKSSSQHAFSLEELESIHQQAAQIPFSQEALESLHTIKATLEQLKHNPALVAKFLGESAPTKEGEEDTEPDSNLIATPSDRRFKQCAQLLQVAALLSDQKQVSTPDLALLRHCLWDSLEQIPLVNAILAQCLKSSHTRAKDLEKAQENFLHLEKMTTDSLETFTNAYQDLHQQTTAHTQTLRQELQEASQKANVFLSSKDQEVAFSGMQELLEEFKVIALKLEELYRNTRLEHAQQQLENLKQVFLNEPLEEKQQRLYDDLHIYFDNIIDDLKKDPKEAGLLEAFQTLRLRLQELLRDAQAGVLEKQRQEQQLQTLTQSITEIIQKHGRMDNKKVINTKEFKKAITDIARALENYIRGKQKLNQLEKVLDDIDYPCGDGHTECLSNYSRNCVPHLLGLAKRIKQTYKNTK